MENINSQNLTSASVEKKPIYPEVAIPEAFKGGFPEGYRPWPKGWSFTVDEMKEQLPDGTYKMLTLDASIGMEEWVRKMNEIKNPVERAKMIRETYPCPNKCRFCFENNCMAASNDLLTWEDNKKIIEQAIDLGLETVKFLGPGEIMNNPDLFKYLDFFREKGLNFSIFTKPAILTDEANAREVFGMSSQELCEKIASYQNVSLLVNFMSADAKTEEGLVGSQIENFADKRNKAIEIFARLGMNSDPNNQRLTLICAPVLRKNIDEVLEIYKWGVSRNIPVVVAPSMVSGQGESVEELYDEEFKNEALVDLYVGIYQWMIEKGLMTLEQIKREGVSPYAGFACNQFISGIFVRKDGSVQACPGNETPKFKYVNDIRENGDVPPGRLKEAWVNSMGYEMRKELVETGRITLTQPCYAKTENLIQKKGVAQIPEGQGAFIEKFYEEVIRRLEEKAK